MQLPDSFTQSMRQLLGRDYDAFIGSYDKPPVCSLRINTSKISTEEFEGKAPFYINKIPFIPNGYYINDTDAWTKHPYYYAGLYYIQEASAMLPANTLPVSKDDAVLDLCAAPGGKSTQLACYDPKILISNDISFSRTIPLVKNLELFGAGNTAVTCESPEKLSTVYPEKFDKILVDAPCSGEGMFRKDKGLIGSYGKKGPSDYAPLQRQILESAYNMLKRGGIMLYSTCTFSDIEDEKIILSLLEDHNDLEVLEISKQYGLSGPYDKYAGFDNIKGCVHALPHRFSGEGHFMALIKKKGESLRQDHDGDTIKNKFSSIPKELMSFISLFSDDSKHRFSEGKYLTADDGMIYYISDGLAGIYDRSIRYARTGICMGRINKAGVFTPHTALALRLSMNDFGNFVSFDSNSNDVIRYLKGETLTADLCRNIPDKGTVLVCVDSYPLGFAKYDGNRLKNMYEKGWIYQ